MDVTLPVEEGESLQDVSGTVLNEPHRVALLGSAKKSSQCDGKDDTLTLVLKPLKFFLAYFALSGPPLLRTNSSDKLTSKSSSRRQRVATPIQLWLVNTPYSVTRRTGSLSSSDIHPFKCSGVNKPE